MITSGKITSTSVELEGGLGKIFGMLQVPDTNGKLPLVILSHPFGGSMRYMIPYANLLVHHGFAVFSFDFGGGGPQPNQSEGYMREMSVLTEAKDLNSVIDHFKDDPRFDSIVLLGASQGGFVSSYVAAQRPSEIAALILIYPAFVIQDDARRRRRPDGTFPESDHLFALPIGSIYGRDALSFDIYQEIQKYPGPVLIIHGDLDRAVPISYSERAAETFPDAKLYVVRGESHGFTENAGREIAPVILDFLKDALAQPAR